MKLATWCLENTYCWIMNYEWVKTAIHRQRTAQQYYYSCTHPNLTPTHNLAT